MGKEESDSVEFTNADYIFKYNKSQKSVAQANLDYASDSFKKSLDEITKRITRIFYKRIICHRIRQ